MVKDRKKYYIMYWKKIQDQPSAIYEIMAEDKEKAKSMAEWLRDNKNFGSNAAAYEAETEMPLEQIKFFKMNVPDMEYHPWVEREA